MPCPAPMIMAIEITCLCNCSDIAERSTALYHREIIVREFAFATERPLVLSRGVVNLSTGSRPFLPSFRRRTCPGLDPGPESRFSLALQQARRWDAGFRRHDKPSLHLKSLLSSVEAARIFTNPESEINHGLSRKVESAEEIFLFPEKRRAGRAN